MCKKILLLLTALLTFRGNVEATVPYFNDTRALAMGEATLLTAPGISMAYTNPALQTQRRFQLFLPAVQFLINTNTLNTFNYIRHNQDRFADLETLSEEEKARFFRDLDPYDDRWVNIDNSIGVGAYFLNFGLMLQLRNSAAVKIDRGIYTPAVGLKGYSLISLAASYSRKLNSHDTVGAGLSLVTGKEMLPTRFSASDLTDQGAAMNKLLNTLGDSTLKMGFFLNLGYTHPLNENLLLAAGLRDLKVGGEFVNTRYYPNLGVGICNRDEDPLVSWSVELEDLLRYSGESVLNHFHAGAQLNLPLVKPRLGLNQGYLTMGLGLRFKIITLDYALYGHELGNKPGLHQEYLHVVQLALGWD